MPVIQEIVHICLIEMLYVHVILVVDFQGHTAERVSKASNDLQQ